MADSFGLWSLPTVYLAVHKKMSAKIKTMVFIFSHGRQFLWPVEFTKSISCRTQSDQVDLSKKMKTKHGRQFLWPVEFTKTTLPYTEVDLTKKMSAIKKIKHGRRPVR